MKEFLLYNGDLLSYEDFKNIWMNYESPQEGITAMVLIEDESQVVYLDEQGLVYDSNMEVITISK